MHHQTAEIAFTWSIKAAGHFLTCEQFHPTAALTILQRGFIDPVHQLIGELIALIEYSCRYRSQYLTDTGLSWGHSWVLSVVRFYSNKRLNWPIELIDLEWR